MSAILVLALAVLTGCSNQDSDDAATIAQPEDVYTPEESTADDDEYEQETERGQEENPGSENMSDPVEDIDNEEIVASVNGISITAADVFQEIDWVVHMLMQEYIDLFPDDMEFDFDKLFRDDMTFGETVLSEAARYAALSKLFEEYASLRGIEGDEFTHVVMAVILTVMEDPDMFAPFEQYMPEEDGGMSPEELLALELIERANAGEDFWTLIETYGQDPGMWSNPEGYTFTTGVMVPSFEMATRELEIGEISGVVWSDFGIHIIKRVEPDPDNVMHSQFALSEDEEEELLAAMHILIEADGPMSHEEMMMEAIFVGFEEKLENADFVLLPALFDISLGG